MDGSAQRVGAVLVMVLAVVALASGGSGASRQPAERMEKRSELPPLVESEAARALREGRPIQLNDASVQDLELLPGIGPTLAARIVESRERDGRFPDIASLTRVSGIGRRTVERLRGLLVAHAPAGGESVDPERSLASPDAER